jgi:hypothetical protein
MDARQIRWQIRKEVEDQYITGTGLSKIFPRKQILKLVKDLVDKRFFQVLDAYYPWF